MNSQDLLSRRRKLKEELAGIEVETDRVIRETETQDFKRWISSGGESAPSLNGKVSELRKKHQYLSKIKIHLNKQIEQVLKDEQIKQRRKLEKGIKKLDREKVELYEKSQKIEESLQAVRTASRKKAEERLRLDNELNSLNNPVQIVHLKLKDINQWIENTLVIGEDMVISEFEKVKKENQKIIKEQLLEKQLVRNFKITLRNSKVEEIEKSGTSFGILKNSEKIMKEFDYSKEAQNVKT